MATERKPAESGAIVISKRTLTMAKVLVPGIATILVAIIPIGVNAHSQLTQALREVASLRTDLTNHVQTAEGRQREMEAAANAESREIRDALADIRGELKAINAKLEMLRPARLKGKVP